MEYSIIVPVWNEEERIKESLIKIIEFFDKKQKKFEVLVVDDGSKDKTVEVVKSINDERINIISYPENQGKGFAVKTGILVSKGEIILITDCDLSTPIEEFDKLITYINDYEIVIGSRALPESDVQVRQSLYKVILGKLGNLLIRLIAVKGIKDTQCGFKIFKKSTKIIFEKQTIKRWGFDFEVLFLAQKFNFKIKEVPVIWINDTRSKVRLSSYPKTLWELFKIRINDIRGKYK